MELPINQIICGDALKTLKELPAESIDMCITSPPYFGLRVYLPKDHPDYKKQIGLEPTFQEYQDRLLAVISEIKRVLKKTGSFWLNMGDCYGSGAGADKRPGIKQATNQGTIKKKPIKEFQKCLMMMPERIALAMINDGWILRNKIKWAKQVYLYKQGKTVGSVMPTSVKDRFNESGEELYFFVKSKKYYFDLDEVRLPIQTFEDRPMGIDREKGYPNSKRNRFDYAPFYAPNKFNQRVSGAKRKAGQPGYTATEKEIREYPNKYGKGSEKYQGKFVGNQNAEMFNSPRSRTQRNWREEEAEGYKMGSVDPHRAALRGGLKSLAARMKDTKNKDQKSSPAYNMKKLLSENRMGVRPYPEIGKNIPTIWQIGSEPHNFQKEYDVNTDHFAVFPEALVEIPILVGCPKDGIILDPFSGSGTVGVVAKKLGRNYILIDLSEKYCEIARQRLRGTPNPLF